MCGMCLCLECLRAQIHLRRFGQSCMITNLEDKIQDSEILACN